MFLFVFGLWGGWIGMCGYVLDISIFCCGDGKDYCFMGVGCGGSFGV